MAEITNTAADWWKGYAKVVAKAWSDDTYKERLLRDPRAVLAEAGLEVPSSVEIAVVEDSAQKRHLVLPAKPAEGEIREEALAGVAGSHCSSGESPACGTGCVSDTCGSIGGCG